MSKHAKTGDGTSIHYKLDGPPDTVGFVLIHSLAMNTSFWDPVVAELSKTSCVLTLDCRGHGDSDKPDGPYSVEQFADDVADVCADAGIQRAVCAGASMGGCVSLAVADQHPDLVSGLGLIDTTAWYGEEVENAWNERADKALDQGLASLVDFQKTRWFSDGFRERNEDVVASAVDVFLANDPAAYAETCRMLGRCDLRHALPKLTMPVEIFVGDEDYATPPAMAQAMHDAVPGSNMVVQAGARHFTPLEVPAAIVDLLKRLAARTA